MFMVTETEDRQAITMIQLDFIQMDDYPADSCAISPMVFLLIFILSINY